jgi:hypothetical protein
MCKKEIKVNLIKNSIVLKIKINNSISKFIIELYIFEQV